VPSQEGEPVRKGAVIHDGAGPSVRRVTRQARGWEGGRRVVFVVVALVARHAIVLSRGCREEQLEAGHGVTGGAFERLVRTEQGEIRRRGVIEYRTGPGVRRVTVQASRREARARVVRVELGLVTRDAIVLS